MDGGGFVSLSPAIIKGAIMKYEEFLKSKKKYHKEIGFEVNNLPDIMFDYQKDLTKWSLRLGKSSLFVNTGLGKTLMQLVFGQEVYRKTNKNIIIVCPLGVTNQTIDEAKDKLDIDVNCLRYGESKKGLNIINYEMLDKINTKDFDCIIADESSRIKHHDAKTRKIFTDLFDNYSYKLCCTATPAPNDYMELGTHSEFLNVLKRKEMLSMFFINDQDITQKWRLKGHAQEEFWHWVSSWAAVMIHPRDLGYDDKRFDLPRLHTHEHVIETNKKFKNELFVSQAETLQERREARKITVEDKISLLSEKINNSNDIHLVWCDLNIESDLAKKSIKDAVEIKGSDSFDHKEKSMLDFAKGKIKCLITKPKIAGHGLNWQSCHKMHFIGLSDSFESYYQAVRRCWRFGQKHEVDVNIYTSDLEGSILQNIKRKERDYINMFNVMKDNTKKYVIENIKSHEIIDSNYNPMVNIELPLFLQEELLCN